VRDFILMLGYAMCTANPEITTYNHQGAGVYASLEECMKEAALHEPHAYCTEHYYSPARSIRPRPRPEKSNG